MCVRARVRQYRFTNKHRAAVLVPGRKKLGLDPLRAVLRQVLCARCKFLGFQSLLLHLFLKCVSCIVFAFHRPGVRPHKIKANQPCDVMVTRSVTVGGVDVGGNDKLYPSTRVNLSKRNARAKKKQAAKEEAKTKVF